MDCCCSGAKMTKETTQNACNDCGKIGRIVNRQTVVHHVKSEKLSRVKSDEYKFCSSQECPIVYYSVSGEIFTTGDVRDSVTSKTTGDDRPLCYCFGFTEGFARQEIRQTGNSSISKLVSQFIKEKLCSCEIRNPAGACCLGEMTQTVKRILQESQKAEV